MSDANIDIIIIYSNKNRFNLNLKARRLSRLKKWQMILKIFKKCYER